VLSINLESIEIDLRCPNVGNQFIEMQMSVGFTHDKCKCHSKKRYNEGYYSTLKMKEEEGQN